MQYTPPHSPPPDEEDTSASTKFKMDHLSAQAMFPKRPISPPLSSGDTSDSQSHSDYNYRHQPPVSLLSALLHSPESQHLNPFNTSRPASAAQHGAGAGGGYLSPHSSVPSTAMSSPNLKPGHPAQLVPAMSILRRDSLSSDGGEALAMAQAQNQTLEVRTEVCHHIPLPFPSSPCYAPPLVYLMGPA